MFRDDLEARLACIFPVRRNSGVNRKHFFWSVNVSSAAVIGTDSIAIPCGVFDAGDGRGRLYGTSLNRGNLVLFSFDLELVCGHSTIELVRYD